MTSTTSPNPSPPPAQTPTQTDEPPPLLGSWPRLYAAVLFHLLAWIVVFYLFTIHFDLPQ